MEIANMSNGKIAIILLNYNDSRFLIDMVNKIQDQKPDEFIIVDDRSTDRSLELIGCIKKRCLRESVVKNHGVHSPYGAFVAGCRSTDAEYVICFSADDYPNPGYLDAMKSAVRDFPLVDLYQCNADVIRENRRYKRILFPFTAYVSPDYAVKIFKAGYAKNINLCGVLIKRELVLKCWDEGGKDAELNFDCMFSGFAEFSTGFVSLGDCLVTYRSYPNSFGATGNSRKIKESTIIHQEMFKKYPEIYKRAMESGLWSVKARWMSLIALWGIMKLPKWVRFKFYDWFYRYSQAIEKL